MKNKIIVLGIVSAFSFSSVGAATETICQGKNNICGNKIEQFNFGYTAEDVSEIVADAVRAHDVRADVRHKADAETIKTLTIAVTNLAQGKTKAAKSQVEAAFAALRKGDFNLALSLFEQEDARLDEEADDKGRAEIKRNIGSLALLEGNLQKSLKAYRRSTELDPDHIDGWNGLGNSLTKMGELDSAISVYEKSLALGLSHKNQSEVLTVYINSLGVYERLGKLDKVIDLKDKAELILKALLINEALGRKEASSNPYGYVGLVYKTKGDFNKSIMYYRKSLQLYEIMDNKEGMVNTYETLGDVYEEQGNKTEAKHYWKKSIELYKYIGSPKGKTVHGFLDELPR